MNKVKINQKINKFIKKNIKVTQIIKKIKPSPITKKTKQKIFTTKDKKIKENKLKNIKKIFKFS
jgi:hypothetical protein